ncbi:MAG TPA: TetR/AcrR family transcriptional regulator [Rhodopila sp.]|jgi:TetR/AcrR family transcriptional regulator|nr:TetR/AcrR family transcriptional regulator [Rhodopila sp.]
MNTILVSSEAAEDSMAHVEREERWGDHVSVDERRNEILRSLGIVLRERGFGSLRMQDIADHLNMTKGNLYYYFASKQELLFHCHMKCMDVSMAALAAVEKDNRDAAEKLRTLLTLHIAGILEEAYGAVLLTDLEDLAPDHRRRYVGLRDRFERGVRSIIREGIAAGFFRKTDPRVATFSILGAINWMPKWYRPDGAWSAGDIAHKFADFFVESLRT